MTNDKQRERLVELIGCACREYAEYSSEMFAEGNYGIESMEEYVADYILKRGALCPPYKVGDTAYFLIEDKVAGEKYISPEPITDVCTKGFYTSGHEDSDENGDLWLWSDVGGIVFLDKTKAEEALKAREKDVIC